MKKLFFMAFVALFSAGIANAQSPTTQEPAAQEQNIPGPKISFASMEHDYGTVEKGGDGDCIFEFTNNGDEPLILSNVRASCGCTTPQWTQKPVMPGQKGTIQVHYNTNNVGLINKTVTVQSNAVDSPRVILKIKGNVIATTEPIQE